MPTGKKIEKELREKVEKELNNYAGWWWSEPDCKKLNQIARLKASVIIKLVRKYDQDENRE
jgi:hypothetical protein